MAHRLLLTDRKLEKLILTGLRQGTIGTDSVMLFIILYICTLIL